MTQRTPEEIARIYVEAIYGQPNVWGQYCHPEYGPSHAIMWALRQAVGEDECRRLIDQEMVKYLNEKV